MLCCVPSGATQFIPQRRLIDAAIEGGVELFMASEYSANVKGPHYQVFPTEVVGGKFKVRKYPEDEASEGEIS